MKDEIIMTEEKLFEIFIENYNVDNCHPNDMEKLYTYIEYCCKNNIDEERMLDIINSSKLPIYNKELLQQKASSIYWYLKR